VFQATNDSELLKVLAETDISVPRRSEGRTKDHTERYAISHMLSALVGKNHFSYPFKLIRRERPDFLLTSDTYQIGIEHTEAVPQNEAHRTVLRDRVNGPDMYFYPHHQPGEPKKTSAELVKEITENRVGDGWAGNSVEKEWAEVMFHFVERKVVTLLKNGFETFDEDWLLIYDNWSLPALEHNIALSILWDFVAASHVLEKFERIFIITGKHICDISSSRITRHDINDLWV